MVRRVACTALTLLALSSAALAQDQKPAPAELFKPLHVGDAAPAIDIQHWVKGDKIAKFEPNQIYIVEFWATWCGPCRVSMPHLSEIQKLKKDYDVTIIGISDEKLEVVQEWLKTENKELQKTWDEVIGYTLTTDPDRSAYESYMYGVGAGGIPTAFIVGRDGKIEWVGNPHPNMKQFEPSLKTIDEALDAVVAGTWDRDAFAKEFEPKAEKDRTELAKRLTAQAKFKPHLDALKKARDAQDWAAAERALDELVKISERPAQYEFQKFTLLLNEQKNPGKAYEYARTLIEKHDKEAMFLNQIAWYIVDNPAVTERNYDVALEAATRANQAANESDAAILDTLARVHYEKGDLAKAVETQKKAVEHITDGPMAEGIKEALKKYEEELAKKN